MLLVLTSVFTHQNYWFMGITPFLNKMRGIQDMGIVLLAVYYGSTSETFIQQRDIVVANMAYQLALAQKADVAKSFANFQSILVGNRYFHFRNHDRLVVAEVGKENDVSGNQRWSARVSTTYNDADGEFFANGCWKLVPQNASMECQYFYFHQVTFGQPIESVLHHSTEPSRAGQTNQFYTFPTNVAVPNSSWTPCAFILFPVLESATDPTAYRIQFNGRLFNELENSYGDGIHNLELYA
jgi:hypothetical protein